MEIEREREDSDLVEIDLVRLAGALWRKAWLIILIALAVGGAAYFGTKIFISPTYRSSFTAYINNKSGTENASLSSSDLVASQSLANTYAAILVSEPILEEAADQERLDMTYEELSEAVTTSIVNDTEIIQVNVTLEDAGMARDLAEALADIAPEYIAKIVEGSSMQVIATPRLPDKIYSPNYLRNTVIGFVLGVFLTAAVIILLEVLNDRVKGKDELEERYGIPVMGTIPDLLEAKKKNAAGYSYK